MTNPTSKTQIDLLGDRLRKGAPTDSDLRQLDAFRRSFVPAYEDVIGTVKRILSIDVTGRPAKSTSSIIEKLQRESIRLTQVQDIAGCRFVVPDIRAQDRCLELLLQALPNATVVDRRERPSHGYRAVHVIATTHDKPIEIQIRTTLQHLWAEFSEKGADVFDPGIKYGTGPAEPLRILTGFSQIVAEVEANELQSPEPEADPEFERLRRELRSSLEGLIERTSRVLKRNRE